MISHNLKLIYPRIGKNASSSVIRYFKELDPDLIEDGHGSARIGLERYLEKLRDEGIKVEDYFTFAFVRNPFDRLVSAWHEFSRKDQFRPLKAKIETDGQFSISTVLKYFEVFVQMTMVYPHVHWKPQHEVLHGTDGCLADYVGRVENFSHCLEEICTRNGIKYSSNVPRERVSNRREYQSYYSDLLVETVSQRYKNDLLIFDYKFDPL
jgi:hypothetical protein